jgi:hypothetical protein
MISKLRNYKKEIVVFVVWFPFLFAINTNLTDIYYLGLNLSATVNAIRIILYLFSFLLLVFLFFKNFKKIELSKSIFFIYLLIFIIQSNFVFSENFNQLIASYKIFISGNIPLITERISLINIGLEVQSIYMMIGSIGALIYFIIFNSKEYETIIKKQITATCLIIASVYLYFATNMMIDYFTNHGPITLYHSNFLNYGIFFGHEMTRATGISRILVMISIITLLLLFRFKNNYLRIFGFLFIIFINTIIFLLSSRFGTFSYFIILLSLILFIKISYVKKIIIIIFLSIIPYLIQNSIIQYKLFVKINKNILNSVNEVSIFELLAKNNKSYEKLKNKYILDNTIVANRPLVKIGGENQLLEFQTTGRLEIWKKAYDLTLNGKINIWIGNGYQTDRKLLTYDDNYMFYGSNISNALLHIFLCSGLIGLFIFLYINLKIIIRIFQFYFIEKIYLNYNFNFSLIIAINMVLLLYLRCLVENSIAYYNIDFLIFLMCLYIIDKKREII